jgi:hypothetical protein
MNTYNFFHLFCNCFYVDQCVRNAKHKNVQLLNMGIKKNIYVFLRLQYVFLSIFFNKLEYVEFE